MPPRRLLIGLSGVSASGKTTVARLLRDILPCRVSILHQDDFFLPEAQLPIRTLSDGSTLVDWDSADSLDVSGMAAAIRSLRETGHVPAGFSSKEDRNAIGPSGVDDAAVAAIREDMDGWWRQRGLDQHTEVFVIDGFLMFGEGVTQLREGFDLRLLLRASYERGKYRRENRPGYATIEGFWTDPPGYWDNIVWPSYVREHAFMFKGRNVEGEPDGEVLKEIGVEIVPGGGELDVRQILVWVLDRIKTLLGET